MDEGETDTATLTLTNDGSRAMAWQIRGQGTRKPVIPAGSGGRPRSIGTRSRSQRRTARGLYVNGEPAAAPAEAGDIIASWSTGLALPWGVGYDGDVVLSNPGPPIGPGDNHNHRFTVDGEFIAMWSTAAWHGDWAADMAYDPAHGLIWQLAVGGDNCLTVWTRRMARCRRPSAARRGRPSPSGVWRIATITTPLPGRLERERHLPREGPVVGQPGEVLEQHFFSPGGRGLAGMA